MREALCRPVQSERPWAPVQIRILLRTPEFGTKTNVFVCCKEDYSDVVLLMVGEEICLLLPVVQTRKVTSDMCDFPPQFARHTSTIARRASAVFGGEQFRHWRIQIKVTVLPPCPCLHSRPLWCMNSSGTGGSR